MGRREPPTQRRAGSLAWALLGACGGAVPVVAVLVIIGILAISEITDQLVFPKGFWLWAGASAWALAVVAVIVATLRGVMVLRHRSAGTLPVSDGLAALRPRAETAALVVLGLAYGTIVLLAFRGPDPCADLPQGSERTACAMGYGALYVLLVLGGLVAWAAVSVGLAITWIVRSARDLPDGSWQDGTGGGG